MSEETPQKLNLQGSRMEQMKENLDEVSTIEKVLAPIAVLIVVGWIVVWGSGGGTFQLFSNWFQTLSFLGSLVVATVVILAVCGKRFMPTDIEQKTVMVSSLLPVVGYLIEMITSLGSCLTVGGSIALSYLSASWYWRQRVALKAVESPDITEKTVSEEAPTVFVDEPSNTNGTGEETPAEVGAQQDPAI